MKDNLLDILLQLCEKSLAQLQKTPLSPSILHEQEDLALDTHPTQFKTADPQSIRVITQEERVKLSKTCYQFLMRLKLWGIVNADFFELLMNQLSLSESRFITSLEAKWTMRSLLADELSDDNLAFLDLVLYQKEDEHTTH